MGGDLANPEVGEPETQGMVVGDDPSCGLFGEYGDSGNFNQAGEVFGRDGVCAIAGQDHRALGVVEQIYDRRCCRWIGWPLRG